MIEVINGDPRPRIQLPGNNRLLSDFAADVGKAARSAHIFQRGGMVFTVNETGTGLMQMTPDTFRTWFEQYAVCYKLQKVEGAETTVTFKRTMSGADAAGVLSSPQFITQLNVIERFNPIPMPAQMEGGYIEMLEPGYDEWTRTFTASSNVDYAKKPPLDWCKTIIDEILAEFAFSDSGRSKAVIVSAMLTVFAQGILPRKSLRPCFIVMANAEGAGKTLLVKCCTVPFLGTTPTGTKPRDEEEMRKVLLTAVMEAKPVLFFDNIKGRLASDSLEGFLTSQDWTGRTLGSSKTFTGENNCTVFITGNGCTVSPDMRRRALFCELFLEQERAEDRTFKQPLEVAQLLERRGEIIGALWGLIRYWSDQLKPGPSRSHASFPEWANTIGAIVECAGYGCPLETPQIEAAADTDGADMRALVAAIADGADMKRVRFDELIQAACERGLFERLIPEDGELDSKARTSIGWLLRGYDRRIVGGHRFTIEGKGHSKSFKVEKVTQ